MNRLGGKSLDTTNGSELTLLRQLKNNGSEFSLKQSALLNQQIKKKTKREEVIDKKIEKCKEPPACEHIAIILLSSWATNYVPASHKVVVQHSSTGEGKLTHLRKKLRKESAKN